MAPDSSPAVTNPARVTFDPAWEMVKQSWRWYRQHLRPLAYLCLIAVIPQVISYIVWPLFSATTPTNSFASTGFFVGTGIGSFVWGIISVLWSFLATIAIYQYLKDPSATQTPWQRFFGARTLLWRYIVASFFVGILVGLGFVLLIVPGIWLAVGFAFVPLIVVYEGGRWSAALNRSRQMVKGHWWDVAWRGFLLGVSIGLGMLALYLVVGIVFGLAGMIFHPLSYITTILVVIIQSLAIPLPLIMSYLLYQKLRPTVGA